MCALRLDSPVCLTRDRRDEKEPSALLPARPTSTRQESLTCLKARMSRPRHQVSRLRLASPTMVKPRSGAGGWLAEDHSDKELLVGARRDPEAFGVFYSRNVRSMIVYFWSRTRDHDVTSDLVAETFAAALASVERYDPAKGTPRQWLYGIANNQLKRLWRSRRVAANARRRLQLQTPPTATAGWDEIQAAEARLDANRLTEALARVPARSREAVRLRVIEQLNYSDIAEILNCKPRAARDLVFRGLRRLRDEFDAPTDDENKP